MTGGDQRPESAVHIVDGSFVPGGQSADAQQGGGHHNQNGCPQKGVLFHGSSPFVSGHSPVNQILHNDSRTWRKPVPPFCCIKNGVMTNIMTPFEGVFKQIHDSAPSVPGRQAAGSFPATQASVRQAAFRPFGGGSFPPSTLPVCRMVTLISRTSIMRYPVVSCLIIWDFCGLSTVCSQNTAKCAERKGTP